MALIRATCRECGDVELRSRDLVVRICSDTGQGSYHFSCPVCRMTEVKDADDEIVDVLVAAGVRCQEWHLPREMSERPSGSTITHDDILDFHTIMSNDSWFETLANMVER